MVVCALISPARALSVEAAYRNLTYTSSGTVPAVGYWQLVAADNAYPNSNGYMARAVSAQSEFTLRISNTISNLDTSWANPYYVQFRQTVKFTFYPGVDNVGQQASDYVTVVPFEPVFELVDAFQQGYLLEDVKITDSEVVAYNGATGLLLGYNVTMSINYTYMNGAATGNPTPITDFKIRAYESFIITGGGSSANTGNGAVIGKKPSVGVTSVAASYGRQRDISDYTPFAQQNANNLNAIAGAIVSDQVAGEVIDGANQDFIVAAASLEADQAVLEGAADASLAAVDYNKIAMLGTYSQSVGFWGQIISALPSVTAAFWEVLVFGFLIAFLVFILRLVK